MRCFKCLKEVPAGTEVCPVCGQVLVPKKEKQVRDKKDSAAPQNKLKEYQIGDTIKDRYDIRDVLSRKGIGYTYKVRDREKRKVFILKEIQPSLVASNGAKTNLFDIIKTVINLNLPEVTAIQDYGEDNGIVYFVSEYIEGLTLRKLLDVRKEMKQFFKGEELESILTHICKALITTHNNGIVHGDLKPENIFILPSGIKITELGITGALSPLDFTSIQQDMGSSYKYIAPEVVIGGALSKASDIYSLGVIVYEMLTGIIPGDVVSPPSTYNSELPKAADGTLLKALQQDPERRTRYVSEFYQDLLQAFGQAAETFEEKPWTTKQAPEAEQAGTLQTEVDEELRMYMEAGTAAVPPSSAEQEAAREEKPAESKPSADMEATVEKPKTQEGPGEEYRITREKPSGEAGAPAAEARYISKEETEGPAVQKPETPAETVPIKSPEDIINEIMAEKAKAEAAEKIPAPPSPEVHEPERPKPEEVQPVHPSGIEDIAKSLETFTGEIQGSRGTKPTPPETGPQKPYTPVTVPSQPVQQQPVPERKIETAPQPAPVFHEARAVKKSPVALIIVSISAIIVIGAAAAWFLLIPAKHKTEVASIKPSQVIEKEKPAAQPQPAPQSAVTGATTEVKPPAEAAAPPKQEIEKPVEKPRRERRVAVAVPKPTPAPKCPEGMSYIPAGNFVMGSSMSDPLRDFSEKADARTYVKAFCIDKYEYPNQEGSVPQTNVSFYAAERYCSNENKRLCTEDEWEKACKGPSDLKYPYGNTWNANKCDTQNKDGTNRSIVPSGSYRACVSGYGVHDMSGDVMEWTSNVFSAQDRADRVVKGGSFTKPDWASRCAYRYNMLPNSTSNEAGFRCCKSAEK